MPTELDIFRSAAVLIEHYGKNASAEAADRAARFYFEGNSEGADVWSAIMAAVEKIQKTCSDRSAH